MDGAAPATVTLKVDASLSVDSLTLHFTKPEDKPSLSVTLGSKVDAALELDYSGQGQLTGQLQLDGNSLASVTLSAVNGKTHLTFPIPNLPTTDLGVHTLTYVPDVVAGQAPVLAVPPAISYAVRPVPTELEIDGFVFKITSLSNPDLSAFTGKATHTLIVGGVEAFSDVPVSFSGLSVQSVSDERVHVTSGEIVMGLGNFKTVPLPVGLSGFKLIPASVKFTPTSADFSGQVSLATTCTPPEPPTFPRDVPWLQGHPTILDIVSRTREVLYGDPIDILSTKGMLPVFAAPVFNIGGQGQAVIRPASTRNLVTAQAGRISFAASNFLGRSQDFRILRPATPYAGGLGRLQGRPLPGNPGRRHQVLPPRSALYLRHRRGPQARQRRPLRQRSGQPQQSGYSDHAAHLGRQQHQPDPRPERLANRRHGGGCAERLRQPAHHAQAA